jgi:phosphoglycolate phosphatase
MRAGLALGIVSTNSEANVRRALGVAAALIDHFDCGGGLFRKRAGLRRLLRQSRVQQAHALYIGDEIRDYQAARAAGIAFGAVGWGFTHPEALRALRPTFMFDAVGDVVPRLLGSAR